MERNVIFFLAIAMGLVLSIAAPAPADDLAKQSQNPVGDVSAPIERI